MKCPECGKLMVEVCDPGYYPNPNAPCDPGTVPDWSCPHCGWAIFDTAHKQQKEAEKRKQYREQYEKDTGFLPGR